MIHLNDRNQDTPLHTALREGNKKEIKNLMQHIDTPNAKGVTPLHLACALTPWAIEDMLPSIQSKHLRMKDSEGKTPLHYAAIQQDISVLNTLLSKQGWHLYFSWQDNEGRTPLHLAATNPQIEILMALLEARSFLKTPSFSVLSQDKWGFTLLHYAVAAQQENNVKALVNYYANHNNVLHIQSAYREKLQPHFSAPLPTHWLALETEAHALFPILIRFSHELCSVTDSKGNTAAHLAALHGRQSELETWHKKFGSKFLKIKNRAGNTPLHLAVQGGHEAMRGMDSKEDQ